MTTACSDITGMLELLISEEPAFDGRKRKLDCTAPADAIFQEIKETALGTHLLFSASQHALALYVRKGKVFSVTTDDAFECAAPPKECLEPDDGEAVAALAERIVEVADSAQTAQALFVEAAIALPHIAADAGGVSATQIRQSILLE